MHTRAQIAASKASPGGAWDGSQAGCNCAELSGRATEVAPGLTPPAEDVLKGFRGGLGRAVPFIHLHVSSV